MIVRNTLIAFWLSNICLMGHVLGQSLNGDFFSQTVYLEKFDNPVTQNRLSLNRSIKALQAYGGIWLDYDGKSDRNQTFTDSQISPFFGLRSRVFGNEWMYSRVFGELSFIHRTKSFPDKRERNTYELRSGLIGYGFKPLNELFFIENYYGVFYSRLYGERLIFQGWARQGLRWRKSWDLFNEIFADTFDLTRDSDASVDLRPGVRYIWAFKNGSVQIIHQWLHHFSNIEFAGRNEQRSTLVIGVGW